MRTVLNCEDTTSRSIYRSPSAMMNLFILTLFSLACICSAEPTWTTLRITWGLKIWQSNVFTKLPLTRSKTATYGFSEINEECTEGKFRGYRYIKGDDSAIVLIYDSKGYIAGIQSGLPKYNVDRIDTTYPFSSTPAFQLHNGVYFRTAYFVDPATICASDRTEQEFDENIGTGLWIQNGTDPIINSFKVPMYENAMGQSGWVKGKCFISMGEHYWYDVKKDMSCDKFFPYFLLYNHGKLTGFGFATVGNFNFSARFEHPPQNSFSKFLDPVPDCFDREFNRAGGFTTTHVYFTIRPWNLSC